MRSDVKFATNPKQSKRLISKPNFKEFKIINENLTLVNMSKTLLFFDKPIFVGAAVLDLSKEHMYSFHYDYVLKKYSSDRAQLLFTDTGTHSFIVISVEINVSFDLK